MHYSNQTSCVNWTVRSQTKLLKVKSFSFSQFSKLFFNLETDEILIISIQVIDLQHECIARHGQDGHHGDNKHIEVTKNSVRRADNVERNESKSERDTPVVRGEVKLDSKGGENSTIYF